LGRFAGRSLSARPSYLADLVLAHTPTHIALVLKDEQRGAHQTLGKSSARVQTSQSGKSTEPHFLNQEALQFLPAVVQPLTIGGIHDPDECVGLLEVVLPVRAEGLLAAHVPLGQISCRHWSEQRK